MATEGCSRATARSACPTPRRRSVFVTPSHRREARCGSGCWAAAALGPRPQQELTGPRPEYPVHVQGERGGSAARALAASHECVRRLPGAHRRRRIAGRVYDRHRHRDAHLAAPGVRRTEAAAMRQPSFRSSLALAYLRWIAASTAGWGRTTFRRDRDSAADKGVAVLCAGPAARVEVMCGTSATDGGTDRGDGPRAAGCHRPRLGRPCAAPPSRVARGGRAGRQRQGATVPAPGVGARPRRRADRTRRRRDVGAERRFDALERRSLTAGGSFKREHAGGTRDGQGFPQIGLESLPEGVSPRSAQRPARLA
jgi:hypothetical protein